MGLCVLNYSEADVLVPWRCGDEEGRRERVLTWRGGNVYASSKLFFALSFSAKYLPGCRYTEMGPTVLPVPICSVPSRHLCDWMRHL